MDLSQSEAAIMAHYNEKTRIAGGVKAGYLLRLESIRRLRNEDPQLDVEGGLGALVEKDLLQPTETGDRYYLTEAGAEYLSRRQPVA